MVVEMYIDTAAVENSMEVPSDQIRSVAQSCPTLWPHELQHARPPCPSPTPGVHWLQN